jgi:hypothetical protein
MNKENFESIMSNLDANSFCFGVAMALNFAKCCVERNNLECLDGMTDEYNELVFKDDETKILKNMIIQEYDKLFKKE